MESLEENQKEMLKIKNTLIVIKNASDGLSNKPGKAKDRIREVRDM